MGVGVRVRGGGGMHPLVRNLYRRAIVLGRDYPLEMSAYREKTKEMFWKNKDLVDEIEIRRAVARGRWYLRNEIAGVIKLKKYRTLKARYYY